MANTVATGDTEVEVTDSRSSVSGGTASGNTAFENADKMDWALARRVAVRISGDEPLYRSYLADRLHEDFAKATQIAEKLVQEETRLTSEAGDAHAVVIDRATWIDANLRSFRRLLKPVLGPTESTGSQSAGSAQQADQTQIISAASSAENSSVMSDVMAKLAQKIGAVELGAVLGWMSRRVLGQYDMLLATDDEPMPGHSDSQTNSQLAATANSTVTGSDADDIVYYVGPNVLATEKRFAFPPGEFRQWLALHELTHRSQFTGVPWLRPYFLQLVTELVETSEPDVDRVRTGLRSLMAERKAGRDLLAEGGLATLFATEHQRDLIDKVGGMMSLIEGHGDATMARAAVGHVPSAERFHLVMHHRRKSSRGPARLLQRLMGIEAKLEQYHAGEKFIAAIESERGDRAVDRIWDSQDFLPSLAEIREPDTWLARVPAA